MWRWWLGNIVFLFVVIPVVILLLNRVLRPAVEIRKYVDDVLENGVLLTGELDSVPELLRTRDLVKQTAAGAARYANAVDQLL